jgi:hypothetical protein
MPAHTDDAAARFPSAPRLAVLPLSLRTNPRVPEVQLKRSWSQLIVNGRDPSLDKIRRSRQLVSVYPSYICLQQAIQLAYGPKLMTRGHSNFAQLNIVERALVALACFKRGPGPRTPA